MRVKSCGCSTESCGCCEGTEKLTPVSTANRPGLDALLYREGTHGTILETMKAALASLTIEAPGADGQTLETFQPLRGLTTRESDDPAIALLDGWATVGDVLTFYQERIANEGYLRTATERRSVLELARLVGYALRPGVASTVYLAYTLEDKQTEPVEIPVGARSQSIPGPDELPQSFETSEKLTALSVWNNLQVRLNRPAKITRANALSIQQLFVAGTDLNLKAGDTLLLTFKDPSVTSVARTVAAAESQFEAGRTMISLVPVAADLVAAAPLLAAFVAAAAPWAGDQNSTGEGRALQEAQRILSNVYLGSPSEPTEWVGDMRSAADVEFDDPQFAELVDQLEADIRAAVGKPPSATKTETTSPSRFIFDLVRPPTVQVRNSLRLPRSLQASFGKKSDVTPQLLVQFAPGLRGAFYKAWGNASVTPAPDDSEDQVLRAIYVLRVVAPLFGSAVPRPPKYNDKGEILKPYQWDDWPLLDGEEDETLFLDKAYDGVSAQGYAMLQRAGEEPSRIVVPIARVQTVQRTAYGISGKSTRIDFRSLPVGWPLNSMEDVRSTLVYTQSEELKLADEPITEDVSGKEIELAELYGGLTSGRWVILSGERIIPGVSGVSGTELLMIADVRQDFDPDLPGDKTHSTLALATKTAYTYKRDTLKIYGNVVKATHGETRNETLGAGDGSQALQSFTLKQPPLTFVPAPNPSGVDSTLKVYVNDVEWHETDTFAGLGPKDRKFIAKTGDDTKTTVTFGNGREGARLPTGVENVKAVYRNGIGKPGNVRPEQVSLLMTKPLGVKAVINPLGASGGADRESLDQARENAPLGVMSLDRLVSVQDYADFTRTFAGIGKARARRLSDGRRTVVHVTIAGADDIPIDQTSDLYVNLLAALREFGDPDLPIQVDSRELVVLVLSAGVRLAPDHLWEPVTTAVRTRLLEAFGFEKRDLGQPALLCEIVEVIQSVPGVLYVDVDAFGGVPEKKAEKDGDRRLLTLAQLADQIKDIVSPSTTTKAAAKAQKVPAQRVDVNLADVENGALRPAQLALFTSAVPDTLILNQIL